MLVFGVRAWALLSAIWKDLTFLVFFGCLGFLFFFVLFCFLGLLGLWGSGLGFAFCDLEGSDILFCLFVVGRGVGGFGLGLCFLRFGRL